MMETFSLTALEAESLRLSLWVSGWAVVGSLPVGIAVAWVLARLQFPGKVLLDGLVYLPLVLPPVVTGYTLLVLMGRNGVLGSLLQETIGLSFSFNWKGGPGIGADGLPPAGEGGPAFDRGGRSGAGGGRSDAGAGPLRVFFTVTLPLIMPGVLAGVILCFARSLSEFGATITFVSNIPGQTRTLPLALYTLTQVPGGEAGALRLCIISVLLALLALVGSELMARNYFSITG